MSQAIAMPPTAMTSGRILTQSGTPCAAPMESLPSKTSTEARQNSTLPSPTKAWKPK